MLVNLMVHTAQVQRATFAAGTFSTAQTKTWTTVFANVPCRIQPLSARERLEFDRPQEAISHRMYHAGALAVTAGDRVMFGTRTFNVVGVRNIDELNRLTTIDLLELSGVDAV